MPNVIQTPGAVTRARAAPKRKVKPKKAKGGKNGRRKQSRRSK